VGIRRLRHCLLVLVSSAGIVYTESRVAVESSVTPIQAELVKRLDGDKLHLGDTVLARLQLGWNGPSCRLRPGDILQARVVSQKPYSKTTKTSELALLFDQGQCGGPAMKPLLLTLAAMVSADRGRDPTLQPSEEHQALSDAVGLALHGSTRSVSEAAETVRYEPGRTVYVSRPRVAAPKQLKTGQVVGIPHLKLLVGQGPEGSSILSSTGRQLRLDMGTQLVLFLNLTVTSVEAPEKRSHGTTVPDHSKEVTAALPDPPKIADEMEICEPPSCHAAFDDLPSEPRSDEADLVLPLKALGYSPPSPERDMFRFDFHAAVAFLGPSQLLFTFDPHVLVKRTQSEAASAPEMRIIRAVVLDLATRQVIRTVDWRVPDSGQYLWPLGGEQVLVHVGNDLRVYGTGLEQRRKISLGAPLAFVRASPSLAYFAIGVMKERHSPEIHRQLQEAEDREPEEGIDVRVLDSLFREITKIARSSRQAFPVLLDDGEVRFVKIGADQWRIVKYGWAGQRRTIAKATSSCLPSAQSLPSDLLFVVGCDRRNDDKWYRVLRDGKVLLRGSSSSAELEHTANGAASGKIFAIGIAQAKQALPWGGVFRTSDLQSERVAVFSAKTGQRILALTSSPVVPAIQTFAISPGEEQFAVAATDKILIYRIPAAVSNIHSRSQK
jgi:hypothetical protein